MLASFSIRSREVLLITCHPARTFSRTFQFHSATNAVHFVNNTSADPRTSSPTSHSIMDFIEACCVCCGPAPRPVLICACDPALTFTSSVYCGTKCRDYDSRTHEKRCEGNFQRAVYRAGDLVRDIFYAFREATFSLKIKKVETRNEELHVYLGDYDIGLHPPYDFSRSGGPLFRFPVQLVSSLEERARLLTMSSCMEAVAFMGELIKHLLEGRSS